MPPGKLIAPRPTPPSFLPFSPVYPVHPVLAFHGARRGIHLPMSVSGVCTHEYLGARKKDLVKAGVALDELHMEVQ